MSTEQRGYGMVLCSDGRMRRVIEKKPWWKRLWCAMRGHGGISNEWVCKRCGSKVRP